MFGPHGLGIKARVAMNLVALVGKKREPCLAGASTAIFSHAEACLGPTPVNHSLGSKAQTTYNNYAGTSV
jgi:hypothetical protein